MRRCPQCDFIYLDTDEVCDLDGAKLIEVNESEVSLPEPHGARKKAARSNSRPLIVAGVSAILLTVLLITAYSFIARTRQQPIAQAPVPEIQRPSSTPVTTAVPPVPEPSPSGEPLAPATARAQPPTEPSKRAPVSKDPVSTSTDEKSPGTIWIKLSNGGQIEADEVWRTKEGVWYRRNGVVTLIKANRVKGIEKSR